MVLRRVKGWIGLALVAAVVAASAMVYLNEGRVRPEPRQKDHPWMSRSQWMQQHQALMDGRYDKPADLLLLGDSIFSRWTKSIAWKHSFGEYRTENFSIGGDTVQNLLWRIEEGVLERVSPKLILLMIGTNNLSAGRDSPRAIGAFIEYLVERVRTQQPEAKLLIIGVIPRGDEPHHAMRQGTRVINERLRELADNQHVFFYNPRSIFLNPDQSLVRHLVPDWIHPSEEGYSRLSKAIKPIIKVQLK